MCITPKALYKIRLHGRRRVCFPQQGGSAVLSEGSQPVDPARCRPSGRTCAGTWHWCRWGPARGRGRQRAAVSAQLVAFCPWFRPRDAPGRDQGCGQGWGRTLLPSLAQTQGCRDRAPTWGAPTQWCWFGTTALYWHCLFLQWPWNVTLLLNPPPYNRSALKPSNRWLRWWRIQRPRFYPWMGKIPWKRK